MLSHISNEAVLITSWSLNCYEDYLCITHLFNEAAFIASSYIIYYMLSHEAAFRASSYIMFFFLFSMLYESWMFVLHAVHIESMARE